MPLAAAVQGASAPESLQYDIDPCCAFAWCRHQWIGEGRVGLTDPAGIRASQIDQMLKIASAGLQNPDQAANRRELQFQPLDLANDFLGNREAAAGVRPGDVFAFEAQHGAGSGQPMSAVVERLLPQRNQRTRTVDVIFSVEQESAFADQGTARLRDGDLVEVPVARSIPESGVWLPRSALTESARGLWAAYALVQLAEVGATEIALAARTESSLWRSNDMSLL